ncbi:MAG: hypothetical protein GF364_02055 [Candidatus Lokiarchaeota archaeon]|nr:hypothetical protein [Candidatus Lokiarchaeota archaeon]
MLRSRKKEYTIIEDELFRIRLTALMDIFCHMLRFNKKDAPPNENECVYGFLKGKIEGTTRIVTEVETILHHPTPDFEFNEQFLQDMADFNARYIEEQSLDRIIGWYKSTNATIEFKAMDVKNHLKFQNLNPQYVGMIIDPQEFLHDNGYGFSVFTLLPDSGGEINIMSGAAKIPWEIMSIEEYKDSVVSYLKDLVFKTMERKKFVTELSEAFED